MKKLITGIVVALVLVVVFLLMGPFYVLEEGNQALVLRFGEIKKTEPKRALSSRPPSWTTSSCIPRKCCPGTARPSAYPPGNSSSSGWT
jgi:modulator of FtsH protease HflC